MPDFLVDRPDEICCCPLIVITAWKTLKINLVNVMTTILKCLFTDLPQFYMRRGQLTVGCVLSVPHCHPGGQGPAVGVQLAPAGPAVVSLSHDQPAVRPGVTQTTHWLKHVENVTTAETFLEA